MVRNTMSILTNLRNKLPTLRSTKNAKYNLNLNNYFHPITQRLNQEIYLEAMNNIDVFRSIEVYKNTALGCNFTIDTDTSEQDDITQQYLTALFNKPEGMESNMTWADVNSLIWDSFLGMGDAFFEVSEDNRGVFNGFRYIHNESIMWSSENDCYSLRFQPDVQYEPDDLVHIYMPNPQRSKRVWGVSIVNKCSDYIALAKNALRYNNDILVNDGLDPNAIISFDSDISDINLQSELDRLEAIKANGQRGGTLALRGATVQSNVNSNKDMLYLELMKFSRDNILRAFQVPPQLGGVIETASLGSGSGDSQRKDWKTTFEGKSKFVENAFNTTIKKHGFTERFKYEAIDVIDELYEAQVHQIYVQNGVLSRDEVRNDLGLDKIKNNTGWAGYYR